MITKEEIKDFSDSIGLSLDVIEKDFVLGWLIAGINNESDLRDNWVFKGGTCLKKCFFENYRFSEDLDFTLKDQSHIDSKFLIPKFTDIADWVYEKSGIELPLKSMEFKERINPRDKKVITGKISYHGPIRRLGSLPRVKLDLSADEILITSPIKSAVSHSYSDLDKDLFWINSYSYAEVFAEKIRALAERGLPRDLYDVVYIYRQEDIQPDAKEVLKILKKKCDFKNIDLPSKELICSEERVRKLKDAWPRMLRHQLKNLPPIDDFFTELDNVFDWLFSQGEAS